MQEQEIRMMSLLDRQRELDNLILGPHRKGLTLQELFTNRCLAFSVELGETANEVRSFKHWSNKGPSPVEVILEEYVDCLHFLLSISNMIFDEAEGLPIDIEFNIPELDDTGAIRERKQDINNLFLGLMFMSSELYYIRPECDYHSNVNTLKEMWDMFAMLGYNLGFTDFMVDEAYMLKYQINIERQKSGY